MSTHILAGFELVYESLKLLAETPNTHHAIHEVLKRVAELAGSKRVNIVLGDLKSHQGMVLSTSDDPNIEDLTIHFETYTEVREVLLHGAIVYIKDTKTDPMTSHIHRHVKTMNIVSLLAIPIRHRGETIGCMSLRFDQNPVSLSEQHLRSFYMIALCLAPKVGAKRLLNKLKIDASSLSMS